MRLWVICPSWDVFKDSCSSPLVWFAICALLKFFKTSRLWAYLLSTLLIKRLFLFFLRFSAGCLFSHSKNVLIPQWHTFCFSSYYDFYHNDVYTSRFQWGYFALELTGMILTAGIYLCQFALDDLGEVMFYCLVIWRWLWCSKGLRVFN